MLNRTLALCLVSVSFYSAYSTVLGTRSRMSWNQGEPESSQLELLSQEAPSNAEPHRGSGRIA